MRCLPRLLGRILSLALPVVLFAGLTFSSTGCVMIYAAQAGPPGRYVPPMAKGEGDFAVDIPVGRNVSYGVEVGANGEPEPDDDQAPLWAGIDLAFRYGLTDEIGIDARITTSILIPLPFPVPNGATVAPIFQLIEDAERGIALHVSPRALWINGAYIAAGPNTNTDTRIRSFGAELPVMFTYSPIEWFDLSSTAFFRVFYNMGRREDVLSSGNVQATAAWPALGAGFTVAAILTAGRFRVSLGLGLEAGPNFATGYGDPGDPEVIDGSVVLYPQGGLSIGAAWD